MRERDREALIALEAAAYGATLFRNNQGAGTMPDGSFVRYGVCNPGGADRIGWLPVLITQEMVGRRVAVFMGVEVKSLTGRLTKPQENFLKQLNQAGGIAFVAREPQDVAEGIEAWISTKR